MFELSVACKYLIPRWRQLSVSIISLVSMLVIALVVWLIVVFFSVKDGLESSWIDKLIALTAPLRITPTEKYYQSYYYLADSISSRSDYTLKTVGEKLNSASSNPYDIDVDEEIPANWQLPDLDENGHLKDLVKLAHASASALPGYEGLGVSDYEMTAANLKLRMLRPYIRSDLLNAQVSQTQQFVEQAAYLGSFDPGTAAIAKTLLPLTPADVNNLIHMQAVSSDNIQEDSPKGIHNLKYESLQNRLKHLFNNVSVTELKTPVQGWRLPLALLPKNAHLVAGAVLKNGHVTRVIIPSTVDRLPGMMQELKAEGVNIVRAGLQIADSALMLKLEDNHDNPIAPWIPLRIEGGLTFKAALVPGSLAQVKAPGDLRFLISAQLQGIPLQGETALGQLEVAKAEVIYNNSSAPFARTAKERPGILLGEDSEIGEGILVPRSFKEGGTLVGDQGFIAYYSPTPSTIQEQRIPVFVAGFYDPGVMPMGGKFILASRNLTALIRASYNQEDALLSNGFNVRFANLSNAQKVKADLIKAFKRDGIDSYWNVETYQEYEFTKDLIQQLHSEKNLFSLISMVIIIVACSNIISMLIILVNDKKVEIGILRSMGATSGSIAAIFGLCGMVMGAIGSIIGIIAAIITLHNLEFLVRMISRIQGYDLFNPVFYGNTLPNEISLEALGFVVLATALISLLAGIVPAVKASLLRPSAILRSE